MFQCNRGDNSETGLIRLQTVDSTHLFALRLIESENVDRDTLIMADTQTSGIGRCGRIWKSCPGNLFMSMIKKIPAGNELSLITACALREVILCNIGLEKNPSLTLHWPNDVYYNGKKLSGILIASVDVWFIVSIGVNICDIPDMETATCLKNIRFDFEVSPIQLLYQVEESINKWLRLEFTEVQRYWMAHTSNLGKVITIKNGRDSLHGVYRGIDNTGKLILAVDDKEVLVSSGDMFENMDRIVLNGVR